MKTRVPRDARKRRIADLANGVPPPHVNPVREREFNAAGARRCFAMIADLSVPKANVARPSEGPGQ